MNSEKGRQVYTLDSVIKNQLTRFKKEVPEKDWESVAIPALALALGEILSDCKGGQDHKLELWYSAQDTVEAYLDDQY